MSEQQHHPHHHAGTWPHHPYTVLSTDHGEDLTHDGRFVPTMTVRFRHDDTGHVGSVKVPHEHFNAAHVDREIQRHLDDVSEVHMLGPQPHPDNLAT